RVDIKAEMAPAARGLIGVAVYAYGLAGNGKPYFMESRIADYCKFYQSDGQERDAAPSFYFRHPCSCVRGAARFGGACPRHSPFGFLRLSHVRSQLGAVRRVWLGPQPAKRGLAPRHICSLRPDLFPFRLGAVGHQMLQFGDRRPDRLSDNRAREAMV